MISCFDALVPRITDGNSKVAVQALQTTSDIVRASKNTSVVVLNVLMPTLASAIGSTNEKIRHKAAKTLGALRRFVDLYSRSPLMPEALYEMANAFFKLGSCTDARILVDTISSRYAKSPFAAKAASLKEQMDTQKGKCTS